MRAPALLLWFLCSPLFAQTVALSFDDGFDPRINPQAATQNAAILRTLAAANVEAAFFPAGKIVDSPQGLELVRAWGAAGHVIGNHTYSHLDFGSPEVSLAAFTADIERQQALLEQMPGWTRLLRFPFLKEGETRPKHEAVYRWLGAHGYRSAPVAIDTSDWYYAQRYDTWRAEHPTVDATAFRNAYLDHIWNRASFYDGLAFRLLKRHPANVLLLHANSINAEFLPDLLAMFRARGWKVVSARKAFADPLYAIRPTTIPAGESIVWSLAKQHRLSGLRYPGEDDRYERPRLDEITR